VTRRIRSRFSFDELWFGPTRAWPLAAFRIAFSLVLLAYYSDRIVYLQELLGQSAARMPDLAMQHGSHWYYIQPIYIPGFPEPITYLLAGLFYVCSLALLLGFRPQIAAALLVPWCFLGPMMDFFASFSMNSSSTVILFVLAFSPCGRVLSLDAWLRRESTSESPFEVQISGWSIRTLQSFLLVWYMLAGISKLSGDWSLIGQGDVLYAQVQGWYMNEAAVWALQHLPMWAFAMSETLTIAFELGAPLFLVPRRIRPFGLVLGAGMHIFVAILMTKLWFFSAEMIAFYVLFLPLEARWIRRLLPPPLTAEER